MKVLFLFDGLDESSVMLKELVELTKYNEMWAIITSRPVALNKNMIDMSYEIINFDKSRVVDFMKCYMKDDKDLYPKADHYLYDVIHIPLFLWYYVLFECNIKATPDKNKDDTKRTSYFSTYDRVMNELICKYNKIDGIAKDKLDKHMVYLGEIAYNCLCEDRLYFHDDIKDITTFGMIHTETNKRETISRFRHKTMLEYTAAKYVCTQDGDITQLVRVAECVDKNRRDASLFLRFVFGFLEKSKRSEVKDLFTEYVPNIKGKFNKITKRTKIVLTMHELTNK